MNAMTFEARSKLPAALISAPPRPMSPSPRRDLDFLVRVGVVLAFATVNGIERESARQFIARRYRRYDDELLCAYTARGVVDPATTFTEGWAADLVGQSIADPIRAMMPRSAFSQLAALGTSLNFGRAGRIAVPNFSPNVGGAFVREGEPIRVGQSDIADQFLTRKKMAVIVGYTSELDEGTIPAFEGLLRMRMQESTTIVMDSCLLDAEPASEVRPAGLLFGAASVASTGTLQGDLQQVAEVVTRGYARNLVLIMHPLQAFSVTLGRYNLSVIASPAVPMGTIIAMDAADFVCVSDMPRFEIGKEAALHFEDETPDPIVNGGPAVPVHSLWQTDVLSLRLVWHVDWCMRGSGGIARTILTQQFNQPGSGAADIANVRSSTAFNVGDRVWIPPLGYFEVMDKEE